MANTTDQEVCSADNATTSTSPLVKDTMNALAELLQGIRLSEEHATKIMGAVHTIAKNIQPYNSPDCDEPPVPLALAAVSGSTSLIGGTVATSSDGEASPPPDDPEELEAPDIPFGHYVVVYRGTRFVLPFKDEAAPYYLITKGKLIGLFSKWENVSPLVTRVSAAIFRRLPSGTTISQGRKMVEKAIDDQLSKSADRS